MAPKIFGIARHIQAVAKFADASKAICQSRTRPTLSVGIVRRARASAPELVHLLQRLWDELGSLYPEAKAPPSPPNDITGERAGFVVAWVGGEAAGCGAFRPFSSDQSAIAEIKRMYVAPEFRRRGVSRQILAELERLAQECGYSSVRLETGLRQPHAIRLYESSGYQRIERYGRHREDPLSVCFEKFLQSPDM